jgi:hypothetical protein
MMLCLGKQPHGIIEGKMVLDGGLENSLQRPYPLGYVVLVIPRDFVRGDCLGRLEAKLKVGTFVNPPPGFGLGQLWKLTPTVYPLLAVYYVVF